MRLLLRPLIFWLLRAWHEWHRVDACGVQTRGSDPATNWHAPHFAATWHDTPTAPAHSLSISLCHLSGLAKHTEKQDSIYAMFCLFYCKHLGVSRKREREWGVKEDSTLTIMGGETDGLCMGHLQPGGRVGELGTASLRQWRTQPELANYCSLKYHQKYGR